MTLQVQLSFMDTVPWSRLPLNFQPEGVATLCTVLYCTVHSLLYCIVVHCTLSTLLYLLHCTFGTVLYCTALYTGLYILLHCTVHSVMCCSVLNYILCTVNCTSSRCSALHCTALLGSEAQIINCAAFGWLHLDMVQYFSVG